jgi:hypothetical protein
MFQVTFSPRVSIFRLAWLLHKGDWIPPTFYPCPDMTGTPDAACVLKAPGNQLGGGDPFYKAGAKPSAGNGRLHQLENLLDHLRSSIGLWLANYSATAIFFNFAPSGTVSNST